MDLSFSLFQWLKTFELEWKYDKPEDLCDGVAITYALVKIAPEYFSTSLLGKIEKKCANNWFLRVSNLRRIYLCIVDFYVEVLDRQIPEKIQPDLEAIARDQDLRQLGNLLQLILGCAINCVDKEKHIEVMTTLSLEVKQALKIAIDELENFEESSNFNESSSSLQSPPSVPYNESRSCTTKELSKLQSELASANLSKENALQRCAELESLLKAIKEERQALKIENEKLSDKLSSSSKSFSMNDGTPRFDSIEHETLFQRLQNQIASLQTEITRVEEQKEDYRINMEIKEKEFHKLLLQVEQLQAKLSEFKHDRDELDRLKYLNEEMIKYKNINEVQKKKLEEFNELKKQIKLLEERNSALIKQTCELEEDKKSVAVYKSQLDLFKKQRDDLRSKVNEESFRADKAEDELKRLYKKYNDVSQEKEKVQRQLESIKMDMSQKSDTLHTPSIDMDLSTSLATGNSAANRAIGSGLALYNNDIADTSESNEKIIRLEFENEKLRKQLTESTDEKVQLLESQLEDERNRVEKLEVEKRTNSQRIIELEGQLTEYQTNITGNVKSTMVEEAKQVRRKLKELQLENSNLKSTLEKKNEELAEKEERFRKHVNKAKETFDLLESHMNNSKISSSLPDTSKMQSEDIGYWRNKANQKETEVEKLKTEYDKANAFRDVEERLMTISFHNLSFNLQRKAAEDRLYSSNFTPNSTFLARQRQASSRKFIIPSSDIVE